MNNKEQETNNNHENYVAVWNGNSIYKMTLFHCVLIYTMP